MPDRSVSVVVDEMVEKAAGPGGLDDYFGAGLEGAARDALTVAGVPAMVEALSDLLSYAENASTDWRHADDEAAWRANIERARAVLGGEVQEGSDRSNVAEALERLWTAQVALRRAEVSSGLSAYAQSYIDETRAALAAAVKALDGGPASTSTTTEETSS